LPIYLHEELGAGPYEVAAFAVAGAIGVGAGLLWSGYRLIPGQAPVVMRFVLVAVTACLLALVTLADAIGQLGRPVVLVMALGLPAAWLLGYCCTVASGSARAVLSDLTPSGRQARVFATQATITDLFVIVPVLVSGFATDMAGGRTGLVLVGIIGAGTLLFLERAMVARWRVRRGLRRSSEAPGSTSPTASPGNREEAVRPYRLDAPRREVVAALSD
jgi:hypothetical protein